VCGGEFVLAFGLTLGCSSDEHTNGSTGHVAGANQGGSGCPGTHWFELADFDGDRDLDAFAISN
jgi:hypothetical protein